MNQCQQKCMKMIQHAGIETKVKINRFCTVKFIYNNDKSRFKCFTLDIKVNELYVSWQNLHMAYVKNKDANQSVHPGSLICMLLFPL